MHGGILWQPQFLNGIGKFPSCRRIAFPDINHAQPRTKALAHAVRFREDLVEARRKSRGHRNRSVGGFAHWFLLLWNSARWRQPAVGLVALNFTSPLRFSARATRDLSRQLRPGHQWSSRCNRARAKAF